MKHRFLYIYIAFVVSFLTLMFLMLLFLQQLTYLRESSRAVDNTYQVLYKIQSLGTYLTQLENSAKGFMLTGDSAYFEPLQNGKATINGYMDTLKTMISDDGKQRNKLSMLHLSIQIRMNLLNRLINQAGQQDTSGLSAAISRGRIMLEELQTQIRDLEQGELRILDKNYEQKTNFEDITPGYFKVIVGFTSIITLVSFFFINKELRRRLRYQKELEMKVAALHRSNEELEQIAHVASHDLQEPLRKIRTFSSRLMVKHAGSLDEEVKNILARIEVSATRMHELINDVVNYTNLIQSSETITKVSLNTALQQAMDELKPVIDSKDAVIRYCDLPVIEGYSRQLVLLFKCLLENSLKFAKTGMPPEVTISLSRKHLNNRTYYNVSMEDNGIGFDEEFGRKIFALFQRLHPRESGYKGQGMGLAIVQRIMINHHGLVFAKGQVEKGAVFHLCFPMQTDPGLD